jgi:hypothetical protein
MQKIENSALLLVQMLELTDGVRIEKLGIHCVKDAEYLLVIKEIYSALPNVYLFIS